MRCIYCNIFLIILLFFTRLVIYVIDGWQELNALLTPVTSSSSSLAEDLLSQLTWPADPVTSSDSGTGNQSSWIKKEETLTSQKSESGKVSSDTATGWTLPANLTLAMSAAQVVAACKGLGQWLSYQHQCSHVLCQWINRPLDHLTTPV